MRLFFNHSLTEHLHIFDKMREARAFVAASNQHENTPHRRHVDEFFVEPQSDHKKDIYTQQAYARWIAQRAASVKADWVIPYRHRIFLAGLGGIFEDEGVKILCAADQSTLEFIENKPLFLDKMRSEGMRVGDFRIFRTREEFESAILELNAPELCIKPAEGIGGIGYRRLLEETSSEDFLGPDPMVLSIDTFRHLLDKAPLTNDTMLMPYLQDPERSIDVACWKGETLGVVTRTRQQFTQIIGDNDVAREMAIHLVKRLNLSGLINLQTRIDHTGQQCLLEINTRASGGIGWTMHSGVNLPGLLLGALRGESAKTLQVPQRDIEMTRQYLFKPVAFESQI